jgi:BSD domain
MDIAYDHIAEETYSDRAPTPKPTSATTTAAADSASRPNLNTEFQETFRAFSTSPWGAKLGGLWGNVRKQGESYYAQAQREVGEASGEALRGFTDLKEQLVSRTRGMSLGEEERDPDKDKLVEKGTMPTMSDTVQGPSGGVAQEKARTESEVLLENDSLVARFRSEAAKRLKDLEKAEDAADEALLRFGTNIRNFLRDAVSVAPPSEEDTKSGKVGSEVLFESKDAAGKRVLHTTRLDAQLHVIHTTPDKFTMDPETDEWAGFREGFEIDEQTQRISEDLEKYPELRKAMEQLVPEKVEYKDFWCRYYFLRMVLETEEQRRKEMLKGRRWSFS